MNLHRLFATNPAPAVVFPMDNYVSKLSPGLDIGAGCYLLIVAVLSILGNLLVLMVAFKRSSRMKPPELLSVNLAVTDLGAAVSMYPLAVASAWSHHWIGGQGTCIYYGLVGFFFGVASIVNLAILAIVRFLVSINMQSHREKISWMKVKVLCFWIWAYALLWALFPIMGWGHYGPEPFGLSCSLAWGKVNEDGDFSFLISMFTFNLICPSIIITCCYFGIAFKLYFTYKYSLTRNRIGNTVRLHRRLFIIAVLISMGFICSWTPYAIISMLSAYSDSSSIPPEVSLLPCMFAKTATAYNPFIYYIFSQSFKHEVKHLVRLFADWHLCHVTNSIGDNNLLGTDSMSKTANLVIPMREITENEKTPD